MAIGLALSAVVVAIVILPIYFLHIYIFMRAVYWWCKPRTKTSKRRNKPKKRRLN